MIYLIFSDLPTCLSSRGLPSRLERLLIERALALGEELRPLTDCLIVQPGDTEEDIVREIGASPLVEPYEGIRFGDHGFHPHWDWLIHHGSWFELCFSYGSSFGLVIFVEDADGVLGELRKMCRAYAAPS